MREDNRPPPMLYKYRDFSERTLCMIVRDLLYYADPRTFNDPLDTRPALDVDTDDVELERVARILTERRVRSEMIVAAETMGLTEPQESSYIKKHSRHRTQQRIDEINYYASDPDYDTEEHRRRLLRDAIESELLGQYEKGIVSLAERANCPLMWSHYGDRHRGTCVGYSVPEDAASDVHKVVYGGSRLVQASNVAAMLDGCDDARRQVDTAVLLRKAENWCYEQEWRLVGRRGLQDSPLEMEEIVFWTEMRCNDQIHHNEGSGRSGASSQIFEIRETLGTFELKRHTLEARDELFATLPRRHLSILETSNSALYYL